MSEAIARFAKFLTLSDDMLDRAERDDLEECASNPGRAMRALSIEVRKVARVRNAGGSQQSNHERYAGQVDRGWF